MNMTAPYSESFIQKLGDRVRSARGWRRNVLALMLGALATAALPPVYLVFLLVPAFVALVWLIDGARGRAAAFAAGWWFGLGHFAAGLYWIGNALLVDAARFGWLVPFAVIGLAAVMALFPAIATLAARPAFAAARGPGRILVLAATWTALEWVRSWIFTGFPWNLLGSAWLVSDAMIQFAALTGVYGLSLLTVAVAAMPAVLADGNLEGGRKGWRAVGVSVLVLAVIWGGGMVRLDGADSGTVSGVRLRLVQTNIPQAKKWVPELRQRFFKKHLNMSKAPPAAGAPPPTHVIWGETAATFFLANDPAMLELIAAATPPGGLTITGAPRATPERVLRTTPDRVLRTTPEKVRPLRVWNSLHAVDTQARVVGTYDKFHLVPFGEYVPFRKFLKMSKITVGGTDFSPGPGNRTLVLPGLPPVGPLICYEVIFPGAVTDPRNRPEWLLNLTNDGWYGNSAGPYQHFAAARLRAVEEGLPLVRVANTGISGVIDAYGRTVARLGYGAEGVLDSDLPRALSPPTPFARLGNWLAMMLVLAVGAAGVLGRKKRTQG